jgi:hypothetical protein
MTDTEHKHKMVFPSGRVWRTVANAQTVFTTLFNPVRRYTI